MYYIIILYILFIYLFSHRNCISWFSRVESMFASTLRVLWIYRHFSLLIFFLFCTCIAHATGTNPTLYHFSVWRLSVYDIISPFKPWQSHFPQTYLMHRRYQDAGAIPVCMRSVTHDWPAVIKQAPMKCHFLQLGHPPACTVSCRIDRVISQARIHTKHVKTCCRWLLSCISDTLK